MRKKKIVRGVAMSAICIGILLMLYVFVKIGFDFNKLSTVTYTRTSYAFEQEFTEIEINTSFFDVKIFPANTQQEAKAYLPQSGNLFHQVTVQQGKLTIDLQDERAWYEKLFFNGLTHVGTVLELYIPPAHYQKLKVNINSGDIDVQGKTIMGDALTFENVSLTASSGDIEFHASTLNNGNGGISMQTSSGNIGVRGVKDVPLAAKTSSGYVNVLECTLTGADLKTSSGNLLLADVSVTDGGFYAEASSGDIEMLCVSATVMRLEVDVGDIELTEVMVSDELRAQTDTGDIEIERSDAGSLHIETDTGDVEMELLSGKMFTVETDTGDKRYPASDSDGGACVVKTDTGDVEITVVPK